jgi:hypothetical protein
MTPIRQLLAGCQHRQTKGGPTNNTSFALGHAATSRQNTPHALSKIIANRATKWESARKFGGNGPCTGWGRPTGMGILLEGRRMLYQLSCAPRPYTDITRTRYTTPAMGKHRIDGRKGNHLSNSGVPTKPALVSPFPFPTRDFTARKTLHSSFEPRAIAGTAGTSMSSKTGGKSRVAGTSTR